MGSSNREMCEVWRQLNMRQLHSCVFWALVTEWKRGSSLDWLKGGRRYSSGHRTRNGGMSQRRQCLQRKRFGWCMWLRDLKRLLIRGKAHSLAIYTRMCCVWQPRLALLRIALALVVGHHGLAAGPNPSLNAPALSPGSLCGPASSSSGSFTEASGGTLGTGSVSPDFWPLPSHRLRSPGQGILIPDMYPTINEAFHAAKSPDVRRPAFL